VYRTHVLILAATLALSVPVIAQHGRPSDLTGLARAAERVVVATVTRVEPVFQKNEHGDELIVSRTHLRIDTVLKGNRPAPEEEAVVVEVEGGTIGELTLDVSDLPTLERGERAVLFLSKNARGANVPEGRGEGILKLDPSDRVTGTGLTLAEIRAAVERGR
jgi:hypothetical protein